jgi:hypothetical protein
MEKNIMHTLRDNYFAAHRSLRLTRDARGVLDVEFHTDGGPCTFSALPECIMRSLEEALPAALVKSKQAKSEPVAEKRKFALNRA